MGKFIERPDFQTAFENMVQVWQKQNMRCETDINELIGRMRFLVESAEWKTFNRWIPCSERIPETGKEVLACVNGEVEKFSVTAYQDKDGDWISDYYGDVIDGEVTHWMHLPEPPKEGAKDD